MEIPVLREPSGTGMLRALAHRNFRLFFIGQGISLIGTWMQQVALAWLVYRLTGSAFLLGLVGCAGQLPSLFLAPLAGVLADRCNRRTLLLVTQSCAMVQALLVAVLALNGLLCVWQLVLLSAFLGVINTFDLTGRQAFLHDMVPHRDDLGNAVALNSSLVNGARLVGPAIAGLTIALIGEGICFVLNALSYLAVLAALAAMDVAPRQPAPRTPIGQGLAEGFRYAAGFAPVRTVLLLLALVNLVGAPYAVLLPIFANEVLHGGPQTLGYLTAAVGLGALAGALYLASRASLRGIGVRIALAVAAFGGGLVALALARNLFVSLAVLLALGFAQMIQTAGSNTVLQTVVAEDKRGRVMSLYTMALLGMTPLGSLLAGVLAARIGAPRTVLLEGPFCLGAALLFASQLPRLIVARRE